MKRAPFSWLSAPTEIFHSDQSALLNSHLTAATQRADSLIVIFGADGIGKTTLLNEFTEGLGDDVCYVAFDETCVEGIQFFRSFLEQMGLGEIVGTLRELQHITSEYLVHRGKNGEHALILVDNAHLVRPAILEQLCRMADVQVDFARAVSMVLAGNPSFQRVMDSPAMRSLKFCRQTNFHIRAYSEGETDEYIRHRLNVAGVPDSAKFSDRTRALIYRFTGGNPAKINALCNAVFEEAYAQGTRIITEQRVRAIAEAGKMLPHAMPIRGKGRRKNDVEPSPLVSDSSSNERIASQRRVEVRDEPLEKTLIEHATASGRREKPANLESPVGGQGGAVAGPAVVPDSGAAGTGETKTLLPGQVTSVHTGEFAALHASGEATRIELFMDGKPWKVVDFAGRPPRMMIGRAADCDLRLASKYVSRHHAMIVHTEDSIAIEDLHSSNGIFVNSEKMEHFNLRPGDTVTIGNFTLRLRRG
jgi:type II secretory pathway predicted ATPase ExeA